jgi:hypothetical protein
LDVDEQRLEKLAKRLGKQAAERLDVDAAAAAVLQRVRTEPVRVAWWRRAPVLQGLAAAAVLIITAGVLVSGQLNGGPGGTVLLPAPTELASLSEDELEEVYDSLAAEAPLFELADAGLYDLTEGELEELLELLEG